MKTKAELKQYRKELDKEVYTEVLAQLKPDKWKKKQETFSCDIDGFFVCASMYFIVNMQDDTKPLYSVKAKLSAKPMSNDPIYWDIAQMTNNKKKPLTFRHWAAFKTVDVTFREVTLLGENFKSTLDAATVFTNWLKKESKQVVSAMKETPFSELLYQYLKVQEESRKVKFHYSGNQESLLCAYIAEEKEEKALKTARKLAPNESQGLIADGNSNDRVNFYELTILYLAGRASYRDEVLKRLVPFDTEALPVNFSLCNFNKDADLQEFQTALLSYSSKSTPSDQLKLALAWVLCKRVEIGVHIDNLAEDLAEVKKLINSLNDRSIFDEKRLRSFEFRVEQLSLRIDEFEATR